MAHGPALGVALVVALAALALAGCGAPHATARPTGIGPTPTPVPVPTTSGATPSVVGLPTNRPGQLDSEWGPIWATLPEGFPVYPGAREAEAEAAASAAYTVPAGDAVNARTVASWYGRELADVGLGGGLDGPLEDGSFAAWSSNGYGCDIRAAALPRGSEVYVTVFYGALCPFEWAGG